MREKLPTALACIFAHGITPASAGKTLSKAAIDIGYHYTWVLALRDKTVIALEEVLAGDKIIRSKLGLQVKEKLNDIYTEGDAT